MLQFTDVTHSDVTNIDVTPTYAKLKSFLNLASLTIRFLTSDSNVSEVKLAILFSVNIQVGRTYKLTFVTNFSKRSQIDMFNV